MVAAPVSRPTYLEWEVPDNRVGARPDGFSRLVHKLLVKEKVARLPEVARTLGLSYANFYARVAGRVAFKPDEINRLIQVVRDPRLCEYLLRGSEFVAVRRPAAGEVARHADVLHAATALAQEALTIIVQASDAMTGKGSPAESQEEILNHVASAERAVSALRSGLPLTHGALFG